MSAKSNKASLLTTVYVEAKSTGGAEVYAFILMDADNFERFTADAFLDTDAPFNLLEYGRLLFCNMGKATAALREEMADLYGYKEANAYKITAPCKLELVEKP